VAFASRCLTTHEAAYTIPELEALAMVWSAQVFRLYLTGQEFTFYTDSRAAKFIMENESPTAGGRLLRWRLALQSFTFNVIHRAVKTNARLIISRAIPSTAQNPTVKDQQSSRAQNQTRPRYSRPQNWIIPTLASSSTPSDRPNISVNQQQKQPS
jgi:hypothetical protein